MSASPPCATPPSGPAPSGSNQAIVPDTLLAAANMRRLLEVYRSLAPLTIGGPSSTSLETPGRPPQLPPPPTDPRLLRKFAPYPWLMGPVFPPPGLQSPHMSASGTSFLGPKPDSSEAAPGPSHRKRHSSSDSGLGGQRLARPGPLTCGSPGPGSAQAPVFSPRDKESSRSRHFVTMVCSQA